MVLSLFFCIQVASGQINSISGTIRNSVTLEPLPYANLVIKDTYLGGTSNVDGYFYLSGLDDDSVQVVCSYMGYITFTTTLRYTGESHIILPIAMKPKTLGGEEVVVIDTALISPEVKVTSQIPDPEVLTNIQLKSSEGLKAEGYTYTESVPIRWLHPTPEFSHYILDGVPVENSRHLYNVYPTFNLDAVKHIEEHEAGNIKQTSVDQTNSIELIYREGNRSETDARAIIGLVESGLTTSGPHSAGGSWYFSGRRVDFDAIYSLNTSQADSVYRKFRPDYYFYDLNGKVTFDVSDNTKISGSGFLSFDKLYWLGTQGRNAHSSWYNGFLSSRIQHRFSPRLTSQTNLYRKTYHSFLRADNIPGGINQLLGGDFVNQLTTLGMSSQADYFLGGNNMITLSVSAERLGSELTYVDTSTSGIDKGWITKAKAGYRYTLPYNLATDIGIQFVQSTLADKSGLNPAILLSWEPSNIYNAHFSLVQTSHLVRELSLSNSLGMALFDMLVPVDNTRNIPEVMSIGLGGRFMPIVGFDLSAEVFANKLTHPVVMDSSWNHDFTAQDKWLMEYDKGMVTGIDLSIEKPTPGIRSKLSYRFSQAKLTDAQGAEISMPGHRDHELYLIMDGKYKELTGYQMDVALASGKHYLKNDTSWDTSSPYYRIDLSFYRDVTWEKVNGRISLRLINITNTSRDESEYGDASWVVNTLKDRTFDLLPFTPTLNMEFLF